ncbi:MAG: DUF349 domain-containing protein [Bacilli bacterium]|nr:DUF349 domain-containing protein [Bacilli bacterium]
MTKQEFIALVKELLAEENLDDRNQDLQLVRREYKYIVNRDEETFFDQDETNKAVALFNELAKKEPKLLVSPLEEKKAIIEQARKLLDKKEILAANRELDKLNNDFRKVGRAGNKEQDDELWNEFRQIKDEFYAKKRAFFEELDKANEEKRAKKENIIERAKEIVNNVENIREANAQMDALRKEWKEVGYSGKGDEYLWKDFAKVMDEFQEKKKERHGEMLKLFEERAAKKEELIKKARILLANSEFTDEEIEKVKALRGEYKAVGFAGKDKDDDLYQRFNEVIQKYFEEMKFYKD